MECIDKCFENILINTDSYKVTHHKQYPPGTTHIYSYFESRGGKYDNVVFFGLQYIIKRHLVGRVVTEEKIIEAREVFSKHFKNSELFYEAGWRHILKAHDGRLPVRIRAVPEGTVVPTKNVLLTIENTDPQCFWLTSYLETLLVQVWYPSTVATNSRAQKEVIARYLSETADTLDGLPFKLHDFGFRGSSSVESSAIGGCAHLVNFQGTDTMSALVCARRFYGAEMAAFSIPAAEHSTITAWGRERETDAYRNMLQQYPSGLVSCVSDSYDVFHACDQLWGTELKSLIEKRPGALVVRPDSGDPPTTVLRVLDILGAKFGVHTNKKGFKLLPPYLRVIQGDGINRDMLERILAAMKAASWSADNLAFGSGGALLQQLDRDTCKCALKCSWALINGKPVNVYKEPITDMGKKSKKGRLSLEFEGGKFVTKQEGEGDPQKDMLVTVFEDGLLVKDYTFDEVRRNAQIDLLRNAQ